jgi:hypothetical protein
MEELVKEMSSATPIVAADAVYAFDQNAFLKETAPELMEQVR